MTLTLESTSSLQSATIIRDFLASHRSGVLATADETKQPHAAVVYFWLEDDFSLLFATKSETQKYKNIQENNQVAFAVYSEEDQTTVQITGRADVIEDAEKRQKITNAMFISSAKSSKTEVPPADKLFAGEYVALRLLPSSIRMAVYARPDSEGDDDLFETLTFSNS